MTIRALLRDQRGSLLVMFPVFILVAAGIASVAVDMGYLYTIRGKVQTTADAAALAGAGQIPDESDVRNAAMDLARKNLPTEENGTVLPGGDVTMGS